MGQFSLFNPTYAWDIVKLCISDNAVDLKRLLKEFLSGSIMHKRMCWSIFPKLCIKKKNLEAFGVIIAGDLHKSSQMDVFDEIVVYRTDTVFFVSNEKEELEKLPIERYKTIDDLINAGWIID